MIWRPHLMFRREIEPSRVERGNLALARLSIRDAGGHGFSCSYAIEPCGEQSLFVRLPRLRRNGAGNITYRVPTDRRAVLDVGPVVVVRSDPFGLFRRTRELGESQRLCICPKTHRLVGLPFGLTRSLDGPDRSHVPHGSVTFHALRDYVRGDDLRHVHWKATARLGSLMVRENIDTSVAQIVLVLDISITAYPDEQQFEEAVEITASLVRTGVVAGYPIQLIASDGTGVNSGRSGERSESLLDFLAAVKRSDVGSLSRTVARLALGRSRDLLLVVTGDVQPSQLASVISLTQGFHRSTVVILSDKPSAPSHGGASRSLILQARSAQHFAEIWNGSIR